MQNEYTESLTFLNINNERSERELKGTIPFTTASKRIEYPVINLAKKANIPILWRPDVKNQTTGKYLDSGKDWKQKDKGVSEDEMVR